MQLSKQFKARCSGIGAILSEPKEKHPKLILSDHMKSIAEKEKRISESKNKETATYAKLVDNVANLHLKTDLLKLNADRIHLSKTCIEHVYKWLKSQPEFYGRLTNFRSKYTEKGNECEKDSIILAADYYGWKGAVKNTEPKWNDYLTGECDVLPENTDTVEDIKNSWSQDTFPLFNKEIPIDGYGWQGQGYLELYDRSQFGLVYTLMDAPERMVERECRIRMYELGLEEMEVELYDEIKASMTYSNFSLDLRVKRFALDRDRSCMGNVERRVDEIRRFIESL